MLLHGGCSVLWPDCVTGQPGSGTGHRRHQHPRGQSQRCDFHPSICFVLFWLIPSVCVLREGRIATGFHLRSPCRHPSPSRPPRFRLPAIESISRGNWAPTCPAPPPFDSRARPPAKAGWRQSAQAPRTAPTGNFGRWGAREPAR